MKSLIKDNWAEDCKQMRCFNKRLHCRKEIQRCDVREMQIQAAVSTLHAFADETDFTVPSYERHLGKLVFIKCMATLKNASVSVTFCKCVHTWKGEGQTPCLSLGIVPVARCRNQPMHVRTYTYIYLRT